MSWQKKAFKKKAQRQSCSGVFSLKDYADIVTINLCDPSKLDSNARLHSMAYKILYCPVYNLVNECKKIMIAHLNKIALHKQNRFFGGKEQIEEVRNLNEQSDLNKIYELLNLSTRSDTHDVSSLRKRLQEMGITWEQATKALAMQQMKDPNSKRMNEYVGQFGESREERFKDYNWQNLAKALAFVESKYLKTNYDARMKIRDMLHHVDVAINAAHNTTIAPVDYVTSKIQEVVQSRKLDKDYGKPRDLGSSVLTYMQNGKEIFNMLQTKRFGDNAADMKMNVGLVGMASADAQALLDSTNPDVKKLLDQGGKSQSQFSEFRD